MFFSKNFSFLLHEKRITARFIAQQLNISDAAVGKWKKGLSTPPIENAVAVCKILDVDLTDMFLTDLTQKDPSEINTYRNGVSEPTIKYQSLEKELKYLRSRVQVLELLLERYAPDAVINKYLK